MHVTYALECFPGLMTARENEWSAVTIERFTYWTLCSLTTRPFDLLNLARFQDGGVLGCLWVQGPPRRVWDLVIMA